MAKKTLHTLESNFLVSRSGSYESMSALALFSSRAAPDTIPEPGHCPERAQSTRALITGPAPSATRPRPVCKQELPQEWAGLGQRQVTLKGLA